MFKALIVDDEEWIRLGLREQADWAGLGIEIAGEAGNGAAALELIEQDPPDIVITDIRMPVMDGIRLMEQLHVRYPQLVLIVISGYSEFEYARKAISFQVTDYILKPIEEEKLEETLKKAVLKLQKASRQHEEMLEYKVRLKEVQPWVKDRVLTQWIQNLRGSVQSLPAELKKLGMESEWGRCAAMIVRAANFYEEALRTYDQDTEAAGFVLCNMVEELMGYDGKTVVFRNLSRPGEVVVLLECSGRAGEWSPERLFSAACMTRTTIENLTGFHVVIGAGRIQDSPELAALSHRQALEAVDKAGMLLEGGVVSHYTLEGTDRYYVYPEDKQRVLLYYVENGHEEQALRLLEQFFQEVGGDRSIAPESVRNTILGMLVGLDKVLKKYNGLLHELLTDTHAAKVQELCTLGELRDWLVGCVKKTMGYIIEQRSTGTRKTVADMVNYLREHYFEEIGLNTLAERFYSNPAYISRIFKQETGCNFNDFLTELRMNRAIELLGNEELRMNDIAEMVGYENVNYFFKRFKEHFGCTPSDYRKGIVPEEVKKIE